MPHSEHLKFKRTIVDSNWTLAPERAHLEAVGVRTTGRAPVVALPPVEQRGATTVAAQTDPDAPVESEPVIVEEVAPTPVAVAPAPVTVGPAPFTPAQQVTVRIQHVPVTPPGSAPSDVAPETDPLPEEHSFGTDPSKNTLPIRWSSTQAIVHQRPARTAVHELVEIPAQPDARLAMLNGSATEQIRAYRLLRHRLLSQGDPRVLAVTSAEPGEGKTTCAANLGLALADETLSRVLLIDANLRRPSLALAFGFEPSGSFMERLVAHRDVMPPYNVAAVAGTRLHIAALPRTRQCNGHIDRLVLTAALHDLRSEYDYIVIDAAAVLESADADVAGECADGVILTARAKSSRKSSLNAAIEQLSPTKIFGTVLIDT